MRRDLTDAHQTRSGEPPPSDTPLQRLDSIDLFNNLLFNRETVYRTLRRASPVGTGAGRDDVLGEGEGMKGVHGKSKERKLEAAGSGEREEAMPSRFGSLLSYLNQPAVAASNSDKHPAKTTGDKVRSDAKSKRRDKARSDSRSKRREQGKTNAERAAKVTKSLPKANTSKRVNGRGASLLDAIIVSDDDGKSEETRGHFPTNSLTPPREIKSDRQSSEDYFGLDLFPIPTIPTPTYSLAPDLEISRLKAAHAKELADLQHQLNASEERARQSKEEAKQAAEFQHRQFADSNTRIANLAQELEDERNRSRDLSQERQHLRQQLEDAHASLEGGKGLREQRDKYERLYREQQNFMAELRREKEEQEDLSKRKEHELTEQIVSLNAGLEDSQREVSRLQDDNATLKDDNATLQNDNATLKDDNATLEQEKAALQDANTALQDENAALQDEIATLEDDDNTSLQDDYDTSFQPRTTPLRSTQSTQTSSPSPSTPSTTSTSTSTSTSTHDHDQVQDYEQRHANMRRTYVAIKKKHDMLASVAANLAAATRGWDYGSLGEFGAYLKQLGGVMGEEVGKVEVGEGKGDEGEGGS